jgi:hypothetical protein
LARTAVTVLPGERLSVRQYLRRRLPRVHAREVANTLRAGQLHLWVDGRLVRDLKRKVIEPDSQVLLYVRASDAVQLVALPAEVWLN